GSLLGVAGLEAGHAATGVEDALLAGVERVAVRAGLGLDRAGRRRAAGRERVAAGAGHLGLDVLGVDVLLHVSLLFTVAGSHLRVSAGTGTNLLILPPRWAPGPIVTSAAGSAARCWSWCGPRGRPAPSGPRQGRPR